MTNDQGGAQLRLEEGILAYLLEARERGLAPTPAELDERFPRQRELARKLLAEIEEYFRLRNSLRQRTSLFSALPGAGTILGDFEILGEISRGGMGVVYRARQRSLGGREVALKVGLCAGSSSTAQARFRREAEILSGLHHPNLAEVHGFGEAQGLAFLAMRLVSGPTLHAILEHGCRRAIASRADLERRVRIVHQLARALSEVHGRGLIHRDVKPTNVILEGAEQEDPLGTAKRAVLVDFGLVRPVLGPSATLTRVSPATFEYASPEQILGEALDARTDVFSLGALMHDLLAGRLPEERLQASAGMEPLTALVGGIDPDLSAIAGKACDPDKRWRYPSAVELEADLAAWLEGSTVSARRAPLSWRARKWMARHPTALLKVIGGAIAVVILLSAVVKLSQWREAGLRAASAWRHGDLRGSADAFRQLPGAVRRNSWIFPASFEEGRARLFESASDDALRRIERALGEQDISGALHMTARRIAQVGLGGDPFLERILLSHLEWRGNVPPHPQALLLLGRYFYEAPVVSPEGLGTSEELRVRARELLRGASQTGPDALFPITALGGCGEAQDLLLLIETCFGLDAPVERLRLGMMSASILLRRAPSCGYLDQLDLDALEETSSSVAHERFLPCVGTTRSMSYELEFATEELMIALALARRQRGEAIALERWLDPADPIVQFREQGDPETYRFGAVRVLLATAGDLRVAPLLLTDHSLETFEISPPWRWGRLSGLLGDPSVAGMARARCDSIYGPSCSSDFERGFERGSAELRGALPPVEADEETLLSHESSREELVPVPFHTQGSLPGARLEGMLDMRTGAIVRSGRLATMKASFANLENDHLRLFLAGESRVELAFQTSNLDHQRDFVIEMTHQAANRHPMPWAGDVLLELSFNGTVLRGEMRVTSGTKTIERIPVSSTLLEHSRDETSAEQVLSLRMLPGSTTTYYLQTLGIVDAE